VAYDICDSFTGALHSVSSRTRSSHLGVRGGLPGGSGWCGRLRACSVVAQTEVDALSLWFRQTAAQQMGSAGLPHRSSVRRYRRLLGVAADRGRSVVDR
jgi:hypothetical protein